MKIKIIDLEKKQYEMGRKKVQRLKNRKQTMDYKLTRRFSKIRTGSTSITLSIKGKTN